MSVVEEGTDHELSVEWLYFSAGELPHHSNVRICLYNAICAFLGLRPDQEVRNDCILRSYACSRWVYACRGDIQCWSWILYHVSVRWRYANPPRTFPNTKLTERIDRDLRIQLPSLDMGVNNLKPNYKRSVGIPLFASLAKISGLVSSQIYPSTDGSRYGSLLSSRNYLFSANLLFQQVYQRQRYRSRNGSSSLFRNWSSLNALEMEKQKKAGTH